jgi:predicted nucleic acid-binding protein
VIVVSNSSPLIALTQIGRLDLLGRLHPQVFIPPAVAKEVEPTLPKLPAWLAVRPLLLLPNPDIGGESIGSGEREVIGLGLELGAGRLILDERPARRLALSLGLSIIRTVGLLLAGKNRGFLSSIKPKLNRLLDARFFMDEELYHRILVQAGE